MSNETMTSDGSSVQLGDKYTMHRPLASGGAARIFLARQIALDRDVVVKVLRRQLSTQSEFCERFVQEARLLARLEHPNIVQIIDFGEQEGFYYFVMEYVRGGTLRDLLERADEIPIDVSLAIAYFVARGLNYVHGHNVLHLDVKPGNILLTREGIVKVADFGLARLIDGHKQEISGRDRPAGTPLYMSPEQVQGSSLDARSDIFSFGILLHQVLLLQNPFAGRSTDEVYRKILTCRVDRPSAQRSEIPSFVDDIVIACLQRDRSMRYGNLDSLIGDLHSALEKLGVHRPEERVTRYLADPNHYRSVLKKSSKTPLARKVSGKRRLRLKLIIALILAGSLLVMESWGLTKFGELLRWRRSHGLVEMPGTGDSESDGRSIPLEGGLGESLQD